MLTKALNSNSSIFSPLIPLLEENSGKKPTTASSCPSSLILDSFRMLSLGFTSLWIKITQQLAYRC